MIFGAKVQFFQKKCKKILVIQKKAVLLHAFSTEVAQMMSVKGKKKHKVP